MVHSRVTIFDGTWALLHMTRHEGWTRDVNKHDMCTISEKLLHVDRLVVQPKWYSHNNKKTVMQAVAAVFKPTPYRQKIKGMRIVVEVRVPRRTVMAT